MFLDISREEGELRIVTADALSTLAARSSEARQRIVQILDDETSVPNQAILLTRFFRFEKIDDLLPVVQRYPDHQDSMLNSAALFVMLTQQRNIEQDRVQEMAIESILNANHLEA